MSEILTLDTLTELGRSNSRGLDIKQTAALFNALVKFSEGGFHVEQEPRRPLKIVPKDAKATPTLEEFINAASTLAELLGRSTRFQNPANDKQWIRVEPEDEDDDEPEAEEKKKPAPRKPRGRKAVEQEGGDPPGSNEDGGSATSDEDAS